jgi:hypothetical protein
MPGFLNMTREEAGKCEVTAEDPLNRKTGQSALAMPNSGSHSPLLSPDLSPALTRLLRTHVPEISENQNLETICKLRSITTRCHCFKSGFASLFCRLSVWQQKQRNAPIGTNRFCRS